MTRYFLLTLLMASLFSSCLERSTIRATRADRHHGNRDGGTATPPSGGNNGVLPGEGQLEGPLDSIIHKGKVDLRHIVDPFTGTYKTKVALPKNFKGPLYLSGLNVSSLSQHLLSVRFYFGRELGIVEVPATVGRAPGITPQTDIEVLILDMDSMPFEKVRLLYDLYDYNDYDSNNDGIEFGDKDVPNVPVVEPDNVGLYCRGLKLEYDPTFKRSSNNSLCEEAGEKCLYAYAKIKDSGLINSEGLTINPSYTHVSLNRSLNPVDSLEVALKTALPDDNNRIFFEKVFKLNLNPRMNLNFPSGSSLGFGDVIEVIDRNVSPPSRTSYTYRGPYRPINLNGWEISASAILSDIQIAGTVPTGLFQDFAPNTTGETRYDCSSGTRSSGCAHRGVRSFLFPRAGSMDLRAGVEHYASDTPLYGSSGRSSKSLLSGGESDYMDGVNLRISNYDDSSNEGIGSCNVTAMIKVMAKNPSDGTTSTLTTNKMLKIQLIRSRLLDSEGKDVLYSSLKSCTGGGNDCGYDECCYNDRCWSKSLVSQCLEDSSPVGNRNVGESCDSDLDCSSLCCQSGTCSVHTNQGGKEIFCSKLAGESCVEQSYCRPEYLSECFIVKTGFDARGKPRCARRCYNVAVPSDCRNGNCYPPTPPVQPVFNPDDPNQCDDAIDPPSKFY